MTFGVLYMMYEQGEAYIALEPGHTVDKSGLDYPYMPPFVGTMEEMEALSEYLIQELGTGQDVAREGGAR